MLIKMIFEGILLPIIGGIGILGKQLFSYSEERGTGVNLNSNRTDPMNRPRGRTERTDPLNWPECARHVRHALILC